MSYLKIKITWSALAPALGTAGLGTCREIWRVEKRVPAGPWRPPYWFRLAVVSHQTVHVVYDWHLLIPPRGFPQGLLFKMADVEEEEVYR